MVRERCEHDAIAPGHATISKPDCNRRHLSGPDRRLATSADPVAAAKVAVDFAKTNDKLEIVGGAMGSTQLDAAGIKALASMPSLDELRAKLIGLVNAPATKVATLVNAPASKLARVFGAYGAKEAA